ncbi:YcnI family protein [Paenibacillus sp. 1P07SE]|uniref:YcnI family copper-binding membrane protein n=1 Tax=Paenibacillus sp. 1P07SE TaxID=3132209 RepID=UPI0039A4931D
MGTKQLRISLMMAVLAMLFTASVASAHVTVRPAEVVQGSFEVFSVRVPSETKGTFTTEVRVAVPEGVNITRTEPKAGWVTELEKTDNRIMNVTWKAEGQGLADTEFTEFRMQGRVADDATELVWRAYQTYADGSIAEWIGAPGTDSPMPASLTAVTEGEAQDDGHGHSQGTSDAATGAGQSAPADPAVDAPSADETAAPAASGVSTATLWIAIAAVVLSALALFVVLTRGRKA